MPDENFLAKLEIDRSPKPEPLSSSPPLLARLLAFSGVLLAGLLGGLVGFGTVDLLTDGNQILTALGGLVGAFAAASGVGLIGALALRAMNEWKTVTHPEAAQTDSTQTSNADNPLAIAKTQETSDKPK